MGFDRVDYSEELNRLHQHIQQCSNDVERSLCRSMIRSVGESRRLDPETPQRARKKGVPTFSKAEKRKEVNYTGTSPKSVGRKARDALENLELEDFCRLQDVYVKTFPLPFSSQTEFFIPRSPAEHTLNRWQQAVEVGGDQTHLLREIYPFVRNVRTFHHRKMAKRWHLGEELKVLDAFQKSWRSYTH